MRLLKTLKSLKFLLVISLMVFGSSIFANTGPTEGKKTENKEQIQNSALSQEETSSEESESTAVEDDNTSEDENSGVTTSSFNYFFYLIYKVKFQDVFKLPNRNTSNNGIPVHRVNINALIERLANPKF